MPRSFLARLSIAFVAFAFLITGLVWAGVLSFEASYSTGSASASPPPPATRAATGARASEATASPTTDIRSTDAAIAAAVVASRDLVGCVRTRGLKRCHSAVGIHDPRGAGAPLTASSFDDYASSWAARVVIVRAKGGLAAVAFSADGMGVGYVVDGKERTVNTVCVTPHGDCTKDPMVARFLKDEARLAEVTRRAPKNS